jgi:hypothetical protein
VNIDHILDSGFLLVVCLLYTLLAIHAGREIRRRREGVGS